MAGRERSCDDPNPRHSGRRRAWLLAAIVAGILVAGGWPGEPAPENRIGWLAPGPGLRLERPSQALSETALWSSTGALTLELWLGATEDPGHGNQEIVSLVDGGEIRPLVLGQWPRGLLLRARSDNPAGDPQRDRYRDIALRGVSHLAVTVGAAGARLCVNGNDSGLHIPGALVPPGAPLGGRLLLGSSGTGWGKWRGVVLALAVYERELSIAELQRHASSTFTDRLPALAEAAPPGLIALYLLDEGRGRRAESQIANAPALVLPSRIARPATPVLSFALPHGPSAVWLLRDLALNVLGFVPLGLVVAWRRATRGLVAATAFGALLSLCIELTQVFVPERHSSGIDLVCNALGALLGGLLALLLSSGHRYPSHRAL